MNENPALPIVEISDVPFEFSEIEAPLGRRPAVAADAGTLEHGPNALVVRGRENDRCAQEE
ncbi:MAG: hypothetical protein OXH99_22270 [Bryobacterales bacterium]|nr:hypothetical protein [Bryobacterales bacterium]